MLRNLPAVSVIVPVYKVEPYIARCAHSLFGQTLHDLEFIFVDDCSPDNSIGVMLEVLESYPERKNQVIVHRMPVNSGQTAVRMQGIKMARGSYVTHCDSDDAVDLDAYRQMYEKAITEDLDIVTCDFKLVGLKKPRIQSQACAPGREVADILAGKAWGTVTSRLIRRELWDGIISPKGDVWEDVVFSVQTISKAKRFGHIPKPLYTYYRRSDSICFKDGLQAALKRWESLYLNAQLVLDYLRDNTPISLKKEDVIFFKYRTRDPLIPYIQFREYYRKWRDTFPEVDHVLLWTPGIPFDTKFWFLLIHIHLYYPWKRITGFFFRRQTTKTRQNS